MYGRSKSTSRERGLVSRWNWTLRRDESRCWSDGDLVVNHSNVWYLRWTHKDSVQIKRVRIRDDFFVFCQDSRGIVAIQYLRVLSEQFKRIANRHSFRVVFRPKWRVKDQEVRHACQEPFREDRIVFYIRTHVTVKVLCMLGRNGTFSRPERKSTCTKSDWQTRT